MADQSGSIYNKINDQVKQIEQAKSKYFDIYKSGGKLVCKSHGNDRLCTDVNCTKNEFECKDGICKNKNTHCKCECKH